MTAVSALERLRSSLANSAGTVVFGMEMAGFDFWPDLWCCRNDVQHCDGPDRRRFGSRCGGRLHDGGRLSRCRDNPRQDRSKRALVQGALVPSGSFQPRSPRPPKPASAAQRGLPPEKNDRSPHRAFPSLPSQAKRPPNPPEQAPLMLFLLSSRSGPIIPFVFVPIPQARIISGGDPLSSWHIIHRAKSQTQHTRKPETLSILFPPARGRLSRSQHGLNTTPSCEHPGPSMIVRFPPSLAAERPLPREFLKNRSRPSEMVAAGGPLARPSKDRSLSLPADQPAPPPPSLPPYPINKQGEKHPLPLHRSIRPIRPTTPFISLQPAFLLGFRPPPPPPRSGQTPVHAPNPTPRPHPPIPFPRAPPNHLRPPPRPNPAHHCAPPHPPPPPKPQAGSKLKVFEV